MKKIRSFRKIGSGMKRFEKGGLADYEREPDAQDRAQQEGAMAAYRKRKEDEETLSKPLAKASFKEAFREARDAGDKTFEYMGKKYTTDLAEPKKESKPMSEGDKGSVNRESNPEAIGPDMSKVNKETAKEKFTDPHEQARKMLGFKKGGSIKKMSTGGSTASRRADGCAVRGKTKGKMV